MLSPSSRPPLTRLAIIRSSSIGDVILATACLDLLASLPIETEISWVGREPSLGLLKACFPQIRCLDYTQIDLRDENSRLLHQLQDVHIILDLQRSWRSHLLCRSLERVYDVPIFSWSKSSVQRSALVAKSLLLGRRRQLSPSSIQPKRQQFEMMTDGLRRALRWHLPADLLDPLDHFQPRPKLPIPEMDTPWLKELSHGCWIAVSPGAAHRAKRAPETKFIEILRYLQAQHTPAVENTGIVFLGDEKDRQIAVNIMDSLNWPYSTLNLAGKIELHESAAALAASSVLLSNDSSPTHLAEAVGTPVAVLFGPTIETFGFTPHLAKSRSFSSLIGCRPCSKHGKADCRFGDMQCFTDISVPEVADHLASVIIGEK